MLTALLCVALAQDAGLKTQTFDWNVPQLVSFAQVGGAELRSQGLPLKMYLVRSKLKLDELGLHYMKRFLAAGFYVEPRQKNLPGSSLPRLTALDTVSMWSYTIIFYPEPDGTTTMLLGGADLGHRQAPSAGDFPAPLFPAAVKPATFLLEGARALTFTTTASAEEVISFYRQTLPAGGWLEKRDQPGTFVRSGRALKILAKGEIGKLGVVVLEDADRPDPLGGLAAFRDAGER